MLATKGCTLQVSGTGVGIAMHLAWNLESSYAIVA